MLRFFIARCTFNRQLSATANMIRNGLMGDYSREVFTNAFLSLGSITAIPRSPRTPPGH